MRGLGYIACAGLSCFTVPAWVGYDVFPWYIGLGPAGFALGMFVIFWAGIGLDYLNNLNYLRKRRKR